MRSLKMMKNKRFHKMLDVSLRAYDKNISVFLSFLISSIDKWFLKLLASTINNSQIL